jgi:hypothetical protein
MEPTNSYKGVWFGSEALPAMRQLTGVGMTALRELIMADLRRGVCLMLRVQDTSIRNSGSRHRRATSVWR